MTNQPPNGTPPPDDQQPPNPPEGTPPPDDRQPPYPGQPYQGQPYPGQPYPGQPYQGQPYPGQPYPGQPYAAQPYPQPPAQPRNGAGITALVLGIFSVLTVWTIIGGILLGAVAIIVGLVGRSLYKKRQATNGGVALTGILLGLAGLIISIVLVVVGIGLFHKVGGQDFVDCLREAGNNRAAQQRCEDEFESNIEDRFSVTFEAPTMVPPR
ncbi:DUF4190 domain-containing protein [Rhodococcus oryzae]|uniref:DUF4190 domain-containing protein n=1 Tax=Rhodococcus oryzae TaxID=2571143 RepID=A0ABY2RS61_9NOCA|nr:DUF4190 domain-containing protein [Rhodococcus oryzae]TJZ80334.1 DUF4190 domain-containing protein [Rhodococcus oryzae]